MQAPRKCPSCGRDLGAYVETHCPQCGVDLARKPPITIGIRLLDLMLAVCGALFVLAVMFLLSRYMNSSSRAELYGRAPYHATTFRVTSVQYEQRIISGIDGATSSQPIAFAIGIVEGQRESMDLLPYIIPRDQQALMKMFPEGTVIPVYLFPTLRGQNRIQRIGAVPTAEKYQRQVTWTTNRALSAVGMIGILTVLLSLARFSLSRNRRVAL